MTEKEAKEFVLGTHCRYCNRVGDPLMKCVRDIELDTKDLVEMTKNNNDIDHYQRVIAQLTVERHYMAEELEWFNKRCQWYAKELDKLTIGGE